MPRPATLPPLTPRASLRWDLVGRILDRIDPSTVLEFGCGQGAAGARLATRAAYLGVEPDPSSYAVARERVGAYGGRVLNVDHTGVPAGSNYDLVCAFEVLEHIEDDRAALKSWVDFLRPGGHLLLSVPAYQERFGPSDVRVGHFRRYAPDQLADLLREAGLIDVEINLYGWPLGYALESIGNRIDAKHLEHGTAEATVAGRTARSGRHRQPAKRAVGAAIRVGTWPFSRVQRVAPQRGIGIVALATSPAHTG